MMDGIFPVFNGKALTLTWLYYDDGGEVIGIAARYDNEDGSHKDVVPYFNKKEGRWKTGAPPESRPLFGLYELSKRTNAPVIVCEGEKAATAARELLPSYVAVTSLGGANAASKTDWSPLKDRIVVIWPDNDDVGSEYAQSVVKIAYESGAEKVSIIQNPDGKKE